MHKLYLQYILKLKIAEIFGKIPVIKKNNVNIIPYTHIIHDTQNHKNNLIGKVLSNNFGFYYIPLHIIENYEAKNIGISICSHIDICPFCFGIHLDIEEQVKLYNILNNQEIYDEPDINNLNKIIRDKYCFELVKQLLEAAFRKSRAKTQDLENPARKL